MGQDTSQLLSVIAKLDSDIDTQRGRVGLMQRWLDDHTARLDDLAARIDASLVRIDALLARSRR
jgi:flagellin-like hook-associated protein FlgL